MIKPRRKIKTPINLVKAFTSSKPSEVPPMSLTTALSYYLLSSNYPPKIGATVGGGWKQEERHSSRHLC
jgi:hypothetical protein